MDGFFTQLLTMLGYQLPDLLAGVAGIAMLAMWAPSAPGRKLALTGTALILVTAVLRAVMSVWQAWLIHDSADGYGALGGMMSLISALGMLLGVASAAGLVMLIWGTCKAMQAVPRG